MARSKIISIRIYKDPFCIFFLYIKMRPTASKKHSWFFKWREATGIIRKAYDWSHNVLWKNTVLKEPKQLNIDGKEKYCWILVCRNSQYEKQTNIGLVSVQTKMQSQNCISCGMKKSNHFKELVGKICFKLQMTYCLNTEYHKPT